MDSVGQRVYVWGSALTGALGIPQYLKPRKRMSERPIQQRPVRLQFAYHNEVIDVACGYGFTVMAVDSTDTNKVFGTGLNSCSQIGYHDPRKGHPLEIVTAPVPIPVPISPSDKIVKVACGRAHTIALSNNGLVYSLGDNSYGQCGRPILKNEQYKGNPRIYSVEIEEPVDNVVCGQDHSIFLTKNGKIYSCGWGADGQTGQGHYQNEWRTSRVRGDIDGEKIVQVSCAADCILALSDKGEAFGWGNSEYGQFSLVTDEQQLHTPRRLDLKNCGKIVNVSAAGTMCAVVNDIGEVFVWGYGLLGKGPDVEHSKGPSQIPPPLFGSNPFCPNVKVIRVYSGVSHFAAVTSIGGLYTWGKNKMHCLGTSYKADQTYPIQVPIPAQVTKVACGIDHTVALCKPFI